MIRGEGTAIVRGVTPEEVFYFVLDPAQYTKADTKIVWVTKLADTPDGMIAREDGKFLGLLPGSVITRYRWEPPNRIDVRLERGVRDRSMPGSKRCPGASTRPPRPSRRRSGEPGSAAW
jgi:hypothetical protein